VTTPEAIIGALNIVEAEFRFHADRLERHVEPDTDSERDHLRDLATGYRSAAHHCGILRRYQEGRVRREGAAVEEDGVDEAGRAGAYLK
jgi:hypothetical protein